MENQCIIGGLGCLVSVDRLPTRVSWTPARQSDSEDDQSSGDHVERVYTRIYQYVARGGIAGDTNATLVDHTHTTAELLPIGFRVR